MFFSATDGSLYTTFRIENVVLKVVRPDPSVYTVTSSVLPDGLGVVRGRINPAGATAVSGGGSISFTATPNDGYEIDDWRLDNQIVPSVHGASIVTLGGITSDHAVSVSFKPIILTITAFVVPNPSGIAGGTINPSGTISVPWGGGITFTAIPDIGYEVEFWKLDDQTFPGNSTVAAISGILRGFTISVGFKLKTFSVTRSITGNGSITLSPDKSLYNYGEQVTATAIPVTDNHFDRWDGDVSGYSQGVTFTVSRNMAISATFQRNYDPQVAGTLSIGGGGPIGSPLQISIPNAEGNLVKRVLFSSDDVGCWISETVVINSQVISANPVSTAAFRGCLDYAGAPYTTAFNRFLYFPIDGLNHANVRVNSIMDHCSRPKVDRYGVVTAQPHYEDGRPPDNHIIQASSGEVARERDGHLDYGYRRSAPRDPGFDYRGDGHPEYFFYDGHPGYDFGRTAPDGTAKTNILAAASGWIVPQECGGFENKIFIAHPNGYATRYLHCDSWKDYIHAPNTTRGRGDLQLWTAQRVWVEAGCEIATMGSAGQRGVVGVNAVRDMQRFPGMHLHLEVYKYNSISKQYDLMDPYGRKTRDGSVIYTPLWLEATIQKNETHYPEGDNHIPYPFGQVCPLVFIP